MHKLSVLMIRFIARALCTRTSRDVARRFFATDMASVPHSLLMRRLKLACVRQSVRQLSRGLQSKTIESTRTRQELMHACAVCRTCSKAAAVAVRSLGRRRRSLSARRHRAEFISNGEKRLCTVATTSRRGSVEKREQSTCRHLSFAWDGRSSYLAS
jgi:hypothetical protein